MIEREGKFIREDSRIEEEERSIEKGSHRSGVSQKTSAARVAAELCFALSSINRKHSSRGCSFPPGSEPRKSMCYALVHVIVAYSIISSIT